MARKRKNDGGFPFWIFGLIFFAVFTGSWWSSRIVFVFALVAIIQSFSKNTSKSQKRTKSSRAKNNKRVKLNTYLKEYFKTNDMLFISEEISIRPRIQDTRKTQVLDVYFNEEFICNIDEFKTQLPSTYDDLIDTIYDLVSPSSKTTKSVYKQPETLKANPVEEQPKAVEINAQFFIDKIDALNIDIKAEEITTDLFETTAMLKQISNIEEKYPDSKEKLTKLYQYYLPILVTILENYTKLINSNSTHEEIDKLELKLRKTIILVNEALKTITMQLCDDEIIDLKSDMSVLETILRKDGLVKDGTLSGSKGSE